MRPAQCEHALSSTWEGHLDTSVHARTSTHPIVSPAALSLPVSVNIFFFLGSVPFQLWASHSSLPYASFCGCLVTWWSPEMLISFFLREESVCKSVSLPGLVHSRMVSTCVGHFLGFDTRCHITGYKQQRQIPHFLMLLPQPP